MKFRSGGPGLAQAYYRKLHRGSADPRAKALKQRGDRHSNLYVVVKWLWLGLVQVPAIVEPTKHPLTLSLEKEVGRL